MKVASRLLLKEWVDLISGSGKHDIRSFQKQQATIGTKNFANGQVATKIRSVEVGDFLKNPLDSAILEILSGSRALCC